MRRKLLNSRFSPELYRNERMTTAAMARPDLDDEAISPRQPAPSIEQAIQSVASINNPLNHLDLRADPDARPPMRLTWP